MKYSASLVLRFCTALGITLGLVCSAATAQDGKPASDSRAVAGHWQGVLTAGQQSLKLVIHLHMLGAGKWMATMDSPDQSAFRIPSSNIVVNGDNVVCDWKSVQAKLDAKLDSDGQRLVGTWKQGIDIEVRLKRVDNNRPQEPFPPHPYIEQDVIVRNKDARIDLAGTLTIPKGDGPFPAVFLITGSGPQNRDQEILGHKIFKVIADHLTRQGYAVLRCDDRGVAASSGDFSESTIFDFASDAEAAVQYLKTRSDIASNRIGLLGHSEGGTVASIVAARSRDVAFVILLAAAGVNGEQTLYEQSRLILASNGANQKTIEMNEAVQQGIFKVAKEVDDPSEAQARFSALREEIEKKYKKTMNLDEAGLAAWRQSFDADALRSITPWFKTFLKLDPKQSLSQVVVPVLALNGERDTQVSAKQQLPAIEAALKAAGNKQVTTVTLPNLNHEFQTCTTGSPVEYGQITETIAPLALETISQWLKKR